MTALFEEERSRLHKSLVKKGVLSVDEKGVPSFSDKDSRLSVAIGNGIIAVLSAKVPQARRLAGQSAGKRFEEAVEEYLCRTFLRLTHLRPGDWVIRRQGEITNTIQYAHLSDLTRALTEMRNLRAILGEDYLIKPDVMVLRRPEPDNVINGPAYFVNEEVAKWTDLRLRNRTDHLILHAVVSCKWTMRSDRAQNSRSEALNLVRNRKGPMPHIVVITGEPTPSRLASLALGTGDIDCVYHVALHELVEALENRLEYEDAREMLETMVQGNRLKDISDLPLDLAI